MDPLLAIVLVAGVTAIGVAIARALRGARNRQARPIGIVDGGFDRTPFPWPGPGAGWKRSSGGPGAKPERVPDAGEPTGVAGDTGHALRIGKDNGTYGVKDANVSQAFNCGTCQEDTCYCVVHFSAKWSDVPGEYARVELTRGGRTETGYLKRVRGVVQQPWVRYRFVIEGCGSVTIAFSIEGDSPVPNTNDRAVASTLFIDNVESSCSDSEIDLTDDSQRPFGSKPEVDNNHYTP